MIHNGKVCHGSGQRPQQMGQWAITATADHGQKKMWQWEIIAFHVADAGSKGLMAIDTIAMACQCTSKAIWPFWNYISSQSFSKASWPSMCQWFSKASWPSMYAICYMAHIYIYVQILIYWCRFVVVGWFHWYFAEYIVFWIIYRYLLILFCKIKVIFR